jgi:hypothetical protein
MKHKDLQQALRLISAVLADPRLEPGRACQLLKAKRELEVVARSGRLDEHKLFRAVELIATVLQDLVEAQAAARPE